MELLVVGAISAFVVGAVEARPPLVSGPASIESELQSTTGESGVAWLSARVNFAHAAGEKAEHPSFAAVRRAGLGGPTPSPGTPGPNQDFAAYIGTGVEDIPPDPNGAVGPNHLMVMLNGVVRIQERSGTVINTMSLSNFWSKVGPFYSSVQSCSSDICAICDPRILYDPYGRRWITTAQCNVLTETASLLVGVSGTDDPTGEWNLYRVAMDASRRHTLDFPSTGFNKHWIVVQVAVESGYTVGSTAYVGSFIYVFDKADLYAGGAGRFTLFQRSDLDYVQTPVLTGDPDLDVAYLVGLSGSGDTRNGLRVYTVSGQVGAEVLGIGPVVTGPSWENVPAGGLFANTLPQLGTTNKIAPFDSVILSAVYRNGAIWAAHNVHLPTGSPRRTSVQWWQINPRGTVLQRGLVDDPTGQTNYAMPSLAVNWYDDVLIGYSRFASNQYPSAAYSFRASTDPPNTLRADTLLKAGEAPYYVPAPCGQRATRWGDARSAGGSGKSRWLLPVVIM
jgi:hypothetical protein